MRVFLALIVFGISGVAWANPLAETGKYIIADKIYLEKQVKVLELFYRSLHIDVPNFTPVVKTEDELIKWLEEHKDWFKKPEVVDTIIEWFKEDYILPKEGHTSYYYREHHEQLVGFFKLFYYAKEIDKLWTVANVVVDFINHEIWNFAFASAIAHRPDTLGLELPPIYELEPYYFFNKDVRHEYFDYKCNAETDGPFYIKANYSYYTHQHFDEQSGLSYYLEDIGYNSFLYYLNIYHPFIFDEHIEEFDENYGKLSLDILHFILSRYYLERIANYKGTIPILDYHVNHVVPHHSSLEYPNGDIFPERPEYFNAHDFYQGHDDVTSEFQYPLTHIEHIESEIHKLFHHLLTVDKEVHGRFPIHGNLTKLYFDYITHAKHLLGNSETSVDWKHVVPSELEHPETTFRDPVYYSLLKRVLHYYYEYLGHLVPYTKEQLVFPGVEITEVEVDPLVTYFDTFYTSLSTYGHKVCPYKKNTKIFTKQRRLNHKPFTYKIHVKSNVDVPVVVKVFLGPKRDEIGRHVNISTSRVNFVPLDIFKWELKAGESVIKRSSQDSTLYRDDQLSFSALYEKITNALAGKEEFHIKKEKKYLYFPKRFLLPFGIHHEIPYQIYVYIYKLKFVPVDVSGLYIDDNSIFYPLDRHIKYEKLFLHEIPNSHFEDVTIRFKTFDDAGVPEVPPPQH